MRICPTPQSVARASHLDCVRGRWPRGYDVNKPWEICQGSGTSVRVYFTSSILFPKQHRHHCLTGHLLSWPFQYIIRTDDRILFMIINWCKVYQPGSSCSMFLDDTMWLTSYDQVVKIEDRGETTDTRRSGDSGAFFFIQSTAFRKEWGFSHGKVRWGKKSNCLENFTDWVQAYINWNFYLTIMFLMCWD